MVRSIPDTSPRHPWGRRLLVLALCLLLLFLLAGTAGWWWLRGSLPVLEGQRGVTGLGAPVEVRRDAQGLLHLEGRDRHDVALALGYVHAQERFFQMDLQRRNAAGELSALFGARALEADRALRVHRFRDRARRNLAASPPAVRALLQAYADGVNAGLGDLRRPPFEYTVLRAHPEPWRPEDSFLTVFAMTLVLQDREGLFERGLGLMHEVLPPDLFAFFAQQGGRWDAPLQGEPIAELPVPSSGYDDLLPPGRDLARGPLIEEGPIPGSNNWAVSGALTAHGGALVADDMHLPLRVPNIWFRASWTDPAHGRRVSGVTLPGVPFIVAGSNGRVAWGFTNTQGDWSDVILLETDAEGRRYRTPEGWTDFRVQEETIEVRNGPSERLQVRETRWGPVIGRDHRNRELALRWVAHDPEGANFGVTALERADSVQDVLAEAHRFGIPHQNLVMGDADGNIAWTIAGPLPRRRGLDGRLPQAWHEGNRGWDGYHDVDTHPRILNPSSGRLWTANARVVSGVFLDRMGLQGAALGARQQQIRDRLAALDRVEESDMLAIQLDDDARFLHRWRERLLALVPDDTPDPMLAAARMAVMQWAGRAAADDVGYRIVRTYRGEVLGRVTAPLEAILQAQDPAFRLRQVSRQMEYPVWSLLTTRPPGLLNPDFDSWEALERDALAAALTPLWADGRLDNDPWGAANRLDIRHPLADALPGVGRWLTMPQVPMSGDTHMPRVQFSRFGASQRFAVAPGREESAYLHMATGQSAHPLSPFFDAGHEDWVTGRPTSWLPGPTRYRLELRPATPAP